MKFQKTAVFCMVVIMSVVAFSTKASAYNSADLTVLCEHLLELMFPRVIKKST